MINNLATTCFSYKTVIKRAYLLVFFGLFVSLSTVAQKPFTEGILQYKVVVGGDNPQFQPGSLIITIKGDLIRKEMKMNGLEYTLLIDCSTNRVYSLQNINGKKYAIELKMEDLKRDQEPFLGFILYPDGQVFGERGGLTTKWGSVAYKDGSTSQITYTKDWKPTQTLVFERFPGAQFMPLDFYYKVEGGLTIKFKSQKIDPCPVENAIFRIPADYKIITNPEYKELSK